MADLRIEKTKTKLRSALSDLLKEMSFEHITVSDICRRSGVTRITFYAYYTDKFALVNEVFYEMYTSAAAIFHNLENTDNPKADPGQSCLHLLDAVLEMQRRYREMILQLALESNSYLAYAYHFYILRKAEEASLPYMEKMNPLFSPSMTANYLCGGVWNFIRAGMEEGDSTEELGEEARKLLELQLTSRVFSSDTARAKTKK